MPPPRPHAAPRALVATLGIALCLLTLAEVNYPHLTPQSQLALFAALGIALCLLTRPAAERWRGVPLAVWIDRALALIATVCFGYVVAQTEPLFEALWVDGRALGSRAGQEAPLDLVMAIGGILLLLEATRRAIGWTLPLLAASFLLYARFGAALPDWLLPHRGYPLERIASQSFLSSQGVLGVALAVMFTYVVLFVIFGAFLEATGATRYIIDLARRFFRNTPGGAAKVAVLASGLMGSLSGSAVANTATTGTFTIPMMRSSGFPRRIAAGIEAAASSGGALMPPVMGAGAYMMLEIVSPPVTYLQIIRAALIPALLYYLSLFLIVHLYARRDEVAASKAQAAGAAPGRHGVDPGAMLAGDSDDENSDDEDGGGREDRAADRPGQRDAGIYGGVLFFGSLAALVLFLIVGYSPFRAVTLALGVILVLSLLRADTRLAPRRIVAALMKAAGDSVPLVCAAASVGIIMGVVTLTGLGTRLPALVLPLAQDSLLAALALIMISSIILGMGLPSAVCYLLMATLMGPALAQLGVVPLAAHLFIFYFGLMSMVTPPVALAAYTAASIAGSPILATSMAAFRFSLVGFILPYLFVFRPELLLLGDDVGLLGLTLSLVVAVLGVTSFAGGITGYLTGSLSRLQRGLLLVASGLLLIPTRVLWDELLPAAASRLSTETISGPSFPLQLDEILGVFLLTGVALATRRHRS